MNSTIRKVVVYKILYIYTTSFRAVLLGTVDEEMRTIINISTVVENSTTQKVVVYKSVYIYMTTFWVVLLGTVNEDHHQHQYCC